MSPDSMAAFFQVLNACPNDEALSLGNSHNNDADSYDIPGLQHSMASMWYDKLLRSIPENSIGQIFNQVPRDLIGLEGFLQAA
eukprot:7506490-Alexandrium_andersonii.AAC.1